jgi:hypothetical protein
MRVRMCARLTVYCVGVNAHLAAMLAEWATVLKRRDNVIQKRFVLKINSIRFSGSDM